MVAERSTARTKSRNERMPKTDAASISELASCFGL